MKKIIIFLLSYFLLGCFSVSARWYWVHNVPYVAWGTVTSCDEDITWPDVPGTCAQIWWFPAAWTAWSCPTWPSLAAATWNIRCLYWDQEAPTVSDIYAYRNQWVNWTQTITLIGSDTWGSWINIIKWCEWISCDPSTWTVWNSIIKSWDFNDTIKYQAWDVAWNPSTIWSVIVKIDNTAPDEDDILWAIPADNSNLLANDSKYFQIDVSENWWSPIESILVYFENYNSVNSFKLTSDECASWCNLDIRNVDNSRSDISWWRNYSLRISKICDQAWNCWWIDADTSDLKTFTYRVYSNINDIQWSVYDNDLDDFPVNKADWTEKNLILRLRDNFNNIIIPAAWINRIINFTFNTNNYLYLNEYNISWNWVYLNTTIDTSNYLDRIDIWNWVNTQFTNQLSENWDWDYKYKFKIYTPTKNVYDKAFWDLNFNFITTTVNDTVVVGDITKELIDWDFDARFLPIYQTSITWDIKDYWIREWWIQSSNISISQNTPSVTPIFKKLFIEFWSWSANQDNSKFNLEIGTSSWDVDTIVWEWNWNSLLFKDDFTLGNLNLYSKLWLELWETMDWIQNSYFSTHIWYNLDWKDIVYNSDIYWKNSYWWVMWTWWTYASIVKVIWQSYSTKFNEILTWQSWNEVKLLNWSITKSSLKTEVRRNAYNIIKNVQESNTWNTIYTSNFIANVDWTKLLSWSMLYFGWLNGQSVILNSLAVNPLEFTWNKTILVEWWNLYINWNIDVTWNKSLLSIVVLKDSNWNWWNIYIKPSVNYIKAIMYADKSLISAEDTNSNWFIELSEEHDGNTSFWTLKNQLYIYGSVFSENTIGWSRSSPLKCPYYISSCTDQDMAQKYDLNYLRRYYVNDSNSDWVIDSSDTPAWWWLTSAPYINSLSANYPYPLVIQYNPQIQTDTPLIFKK